MYTLFYLLTWWLSWLLLHSLCEKLRFDFKSKCFEYIFVMHLRMCLHLFISIATKLDHLREGEKVTKSQTMVNFEHSNYHFNAILSYACRVSHLMTIYDKMNLSFALNCDYFLKTVCSSNSTKCQNLFCHSLLSLDNCFKDLKRDRLLKKKIKEEKRDQKP